MARTNNEEGRHWRNWHDWQDWQRWRTIQFDTDCINITIKRVSIRAIVEELRPIAALKSPSEDNKASDGSLNEQIVSVQLTQSLFYWIIKLPIITDAIKQRDRQTNCLFECEPTVITN